ncbi:MAG: sugar ABC transporter permease [Firmicutes bacterium]|nr:sugar ABC transporter permease [Bacillota bacterium]
MKETECKKGILRAKTDGGPPKAGRRTGFNENRLRKNLFIVGMLSIAIVHFLVFWLYVNLSSILMAFKNVTIEGTKWGFGNFKIMFDSFRNPTSELRGAFVNTMIFFAVNLLIKLPLTFICSYFLYKKIKGYKYYRFVFFLPSIISAVVLTSLLKYMVNPGGPLPRIYEMLWGREAPLFLADSDYALGVILFYTIWSGFGVNIILFQGAMSRIPPEIIEAGKIDGVGMTRELFQIVTPLVWPTISTVVVLAFVGIFSSSGEILLFTKGLYDTYTISYWIFELVQGIKGTVNLEYASTVGIFFSVIALPIVLLVKRGLEKITESVEY